MENTPVEYKKSVSDILLEKLGSSSGGEAELMDIASKYALQISGIQMRGLMLLYMIKPLCTTEDSERIDKFTAKYLEMKRNNGSDMFIMALMREISLKKFISSIGINAIKQL